MNFKMDCTQVFQRLAQNTDGTKVVVDEVWFTPNSGETQFFPGSDSRFIMYIEHAKNTYVMGQTYTLSLA